MNRNWFETIDETPVTFGVLLAYLTFAVLTDPISPASSALVDYGAATGLLVETGEPWRLLTHSFLHGGLVHLGFNAFALFWIGPQLERVLGPWRFAALYLLAAVGGGIAGTIWHHPVSTLVGGSGALFGMLGAMLALMIRQGRSGLAILEHHAGRNLLFLIAINLAFGFLVPQISNAAHIGGLLTGFVFVLMFLARRRTGADTATRAAQAGWIALFAAMLLYATHPVLDSHWHLLQSFHASTPELRASHAAAFSREYSGGTAASAAVLREDVSDHWGDTGVRWAAEWLPKR